MESSWQKKKTSMKKEKREAVPQLHSATATWASEQLNLVYYYFSVGAANGGRGLGGVVN